jgi:hypothetical protein
LPSQTQIEAAIADEPLACAVDERQGDHGRRRNWDSRGPLLTATNNKVQQRSLTLKRQTQWNDSERSGQPRTRCPIAGLDNRTHPPDQGSYAALKRLNESTPTDLRQYMPRSATFSPAGSLLCVAVR